MKTIILSLLIISTITAYNFPLYKQCDPKWGNEQLGTGSHTICQIGCLLSSAAMALAGTGHPTYNPSTLNTWLKAHGGYVQSELFVWASINPIGLVFEGKFANSEIKRALDLNKIVICNVHNGGHWVLATGYNGDNILVNDAGYNTNYYNINDIVNGENGIYHVAGTG
jgi:hypothetical protein